MKRFCVVFACALLLGLAPLPAQDNSTAHAQKLADIRKLLEVTGGNKMADDMFDQLAESLKSSGNGPSEKLLQEFRKEFDINQINDIAIAAYDKYLAAEDIKAILAFYESPAGKRMVEAMPNIMGDMIAQTSKISQEIGDRVMKRMRDKK